MNCTSLYHHIHHPKLPPGDIMALYFRNIQKERKGWVGRGSNSGLEDFLDDFFGVGVGGGDGGSCRTECDWKISLALVPGINKS